MITEITIPLLPIVGDGGPAFAWMNQHVPLWVAIVAAFTSPYRWSAYVKRGVVNRLGGFDENDDNQEPVKVAKDESGRFSILMRDAQGRFRSPEPDERPDKSEDNS